MEPNVKFVILILASILIMLLIFAMIAIPLVQHALILRLPAVHSVNQDYILMNIKATNVWLVIHQMDTLYQVKIVKSVTLLVKHV